MREADRFKKTRKAADIPSPSLQPDLLVDIQRRIRTQHVGRALCCNDKGQQPGGQGSVEVEMFEFRRHERMECADEGPPSQEIHAAPPELSGAGTDENEAALIRRLDQGVHDVEQLGHPLDFIDDNGGVLGRPSDPLAQTLWPGHQLTRYVGFQKIDYECFRQDVVQPGRFASATGAQQEEAL